MKVSDEVPEVLMVLEESIRDSLLELGLPPEDANIIASKAVCETAQKFGGDCVYIPRNVMFNIVRRNGILFKEYDSGVPLKALARKYSVSERRIYQIIASHNSQTRKSR